MRTARRRRALPRYTFSEVVNTGRARLRWAAEQRSEATMSDHAAYQQIGPVGCDQKNQAPKHTTAFQSGDFQRQYFTAKKNEVRVYKGTETSTKHRQSSQWLQYKSIRYLPLKHQQQGT